ncbi:unnamed protein product [Soboliphyme baturini]|uniref:CdiI_2 domain-containing protein n=1 Tax=Soboliphyme baturini TaxID=241478 RepID=A0A183IPK6_9BILA|nr:unnamed protein product [Soboliphyme baturini]
MFLIERHPQKPTVLICGFSEWVSKMIADGFFVAASRFFRTEGNVSQDFQLVLDLYNGSWQGIADSLRALLLSRQQVDPSIDEYFVSLDESVRSEMDCVEDIQELHEQQMWSFENCCKDAVIFIEEGSDMALWAGLREMVYKALHKSRTEAKASKSKY